MILEPAGRGEYTDDYLTAAGTAMSCQDCTGEVIIRDAATGLVQATVVHADTCPWMAAAAIGQRVLTVTHRHN